MPELSMNCWISFFTSATSSESERFNRSTSRKRPNQERERMEKKINRIQNTTKALNIIAKFYEDVQKAKSKINQELILERVDEWELDTTGYDGWLNQE
jgi:hypothetical protein